MAFFLGGAKTSWWTQGQSTFHRLTSRRRRSAFRIADESLAPTEGGAYAGGDALRG